MAKPLQPESPHAWWPLLLTVTALFALVRAAGLFGDMWLDEIWSLLMVGQVKAPGEILTVLRHDNNHPLNSLWLMLCGPGMAGWNYRLPAWVAGSAAVLLAGLVARGQAERLQPGDFAGAKVAGLFAAVLAGGSYLLIHYSSEARGYGPLMGCALLATWALLQADGPRPVRWAIVYALSAALGLLAHLAMAEVLLAGLAWSFGSILQQREDWRRLTLGALAWHGVPVGLTVAYYFGFVRKLEIGGGPENQVLKTMGETAAYTLGLPVSAGGLALALFALLWLVGLIAGIRRGAWAVVAWAVAGAVLAPALTLWASPSTLVFPRYFLVNVVLVLPVIAQGLAWLWHTGRGGRACVLTAGGLFLVGNALPVVDLAMAGRGQYSAALRDIGRMAQALEISISSDHDFRNGLLIDYYRGAVGAAHSLVYHPVGQTPPWGVQWVLLHRLDGQPEPLAMIADARGNRYVRERRYPHAALSGWDWYLYRNEELIVAP